MLQHHGLHSFFTNCMSNPKMADIYSVASQVFKQLDIAGDESSFHWIDIMDTIIRKEFNPSFRIYQFEFRYDNRRTSL